MAKSISIPISEKIGDISALLIEPQQAKALIVLAHGAGAGMNHSFMESLALALQMESIATLRYNFPYMEQGRRRPDFPAVAEKTVEMVLEYAKDLGKEYPIYASGKSFGGRMSSQRMSKDGLEYVKGLIFYGFPLHAMGKSGTERAEHLKSVKPPMLFLQGTKDRLATPDLIEEVTDQIPNAELQFFENADHSFKVKKEVLIEPLAQATSKWIDKINSAT